MDAKAAEIPAHGERFLVLAHPARVRAKPIVLFPLKELSAVGRCLDALLAQIDPQLRQLVQCEHVVRAPRRVLMKMLTIDIRQQRVLMQTNTDQKTGPWAGEAD